MDKELLKKILRESTLSEAKPEKNKDMSILQAINNIKKVKSSNGSDDYAEDTLSYELDYKGKSLRINRERLNSGKWLVMINSKLVGVVNTLKAAKEVGAYYITK
jgi:hypothetical protein